MRLTEELLLKRYKGAYGVDTITKLNESNLLCFLILSVSKDKIMQSVNCLKVASTRVAKH